jgi:hypothetical protein
MAPSRKSTMTNSVSEKAANPFRIDKRLRYTAVCIELNNEITHTVTETQLLSNLRELDEGFLFDKGGHAYFTPYFYQNNDLKMAWKFARNCEFAMKERPERNCPDSL